MTTYSKIGFYQHDITPIQPVFLAGFSDRTAPMDGVQDPLFLRIMSITDKHDQTVVLITADLLAFPEALSWRIKDWAAMELGIPSSNIILNASHTHYGPALERYDYTPSWNIDIDYLNNLEEKIQTGIKTALSEAKNRDIYYGFTDIKLGVNRRFKDKNGKVIRTMRPNLTGFYDPQVPVMAIYEQKKLVAIFYSCNCHPTSQSINQVSADYPGAVSRALKNILGDKLHTIFAQGAGASAKAAFYNTETLMFSGAKLTELNELGNRIAENIIELVNSDKMHLLDLNIAAIEKEFLLPFDKNRILSQQQLLHLASIENNDNIAPIDKLWAAKLYESNRKHITPDGYMMHVTKLTLNNELSILGLSGEVTGEMGALVKQLFPDESTILLGYCTNTDAYIPTAAMLPEGGYEAEDVIKYFGWAAPFAPEIDKIMQQEISSL